MKAKKPKIAVKCNSFNNGEDNTSIQQENTCLTSKNDNSNREPSREMKASHESYNRLDFDKKLSTNCKLVKSQSNIVELFKDFLDKNFIKIGNFYRPHDSSLNEYRHLGIKTEDGLMIGFCELVYLFNSSEDVWPAEIFSDLKMRIYFDLKNLGLNLLLSGNINYKIIGAHNGSENENTDCLDSKNDFFNQKEMFNILYKKTKHFNRKSAEKICSIEYVYSNDKIRNLSNKNRLLAIMGEYDYCLVEVKMIDALSFEISDRLKKNPK